MARSTFGATNDTNETSPVEVCHSVGIREIRCRLRLREIYPCPHDHENSFHSQNSLLKKTVWNIRKFKLLDKIIVNYWKLLSEKTSRLRRKGKYKPLLFTYSCLIKWNKMKKIKQNIILFQFIFVPLHPKSRPLRKRS